MWNLKENQKYMIQMNLLTKQRLTDLENKLMVAGGEGIVREFGKIMYTVLYSKWITNKDLLYSIWNSTQCYAPVCMGGGLGESGYMYIPLLFT